MKIIGIDIGKGFLKFYSEEKQEMFPSVIGSGVVTDIEGNPVDCITFNGNSYTVGQKAVMCDVSWNIDDKKSDVVSLIHVLNVTGRYFDDDTFVCGVGLPTGNFDAEKAKLKEMLTGIFAFEVDGKKRTVEIKPYVIPEGLGAYYYSTNGGLNNTKHTLIVDIGYKTLDTVIAFGTTISYKGWGSSLLGVEKVILEVSKELSKRFGIILPEEKVRISRALSEYCINKKSCNITFKTKEINITDIVQSAIEHKSKEIIKSVNVIAEENAVEHVVFCGGGSVLFKDHLQRAFPYASFLDDIFANAKGFYYLAQRKYLKEQEAKNKSMDTELEQTKNNGSSGANTEIFTSTERIYLSQEAV